MHTHTNKHDISYAPTDTADLYPDTDGKPMAASDLHLEILIWLIQALREHFADTPDTYVSGDILTYYTEGNPRDVVAPDVLVAFGIGQKRRHTYKVWEEGKVPDFVMEFSSKTTYRNDLTDKKALYAALGISNYLLYDAEALYLSPPLMGFRLVDGVYVPIPPGADGCIHSDVLGLDFVIQEGRLRVYDPIGGEWLQTPAEAHAARADREAIARQQQHARADREAIARQQQHARAETAEARAETAEAEVERLREQLARLQARRSGE